MAETSNNNVHSADTSDPKEEFIKSIELPDINGITGVGIAGGVDGSLPSAKKLPVVMSGSREPRAAYTALVVYSTNELGHKGHRDHRDFMTNAAYALTSLGLLRAAYTSEYEEHQLEGPHSFHMNAKTKIEQRFLGTAAIGNIAFLRARRHMVRCNIDSPENIVNFTYRDATRVDHHYAYFVNKDAEPEDGDWRVYP